MSSASKSLEEFIPWALDVGRQLCEFPAKRTETSNGLKLSLFEDSFLYEFSWTRPERGIGLTGLNAETPLNVSYVDRTGIEAHDSRFEENLEFADASFLVLEMLTLQDWALPGISDWVRMAWYALGLGVPTDAIHRTLSEEVVSQLEKETPKKLIVERILAVLLDDADLASLLSFLAPRLVLESREVALAILRNPGLARCALWEDIPLSDKELLPWVVPLWAADHTITFEQALIRMGLGRPLRDRLSQMAPAYLHHLAEMVLQFSQPGLAQAFWTVSGETVMSDCQESATPGQKRLVRPSVSNAQLDTVWETWSQREPEIAAKYARQHTPIVA